MAFLSFLKATRRVAPTVAFILIVLSCPVHADITTGLVGHWKLDEASGVTATDFSGNANTGTLINVADPATATSGWTSSGRLNGALLFDGLDDYVNSGHGSSMNTTDAITIGVWVYIFDTSLDNNNNYYRAVLGRAIDANYGFLLTTFPGGGIVFNYKSGGVQYTQQTPTVSMNTWYHIVGTFDGSSIKIYTNGQDTSYVGGFYRDHGSNDLLIGARAVGVGRFKGIIDDVRIYNRALTAADAFELYKWPGPASTTITNATLGAATLQ